MAKVSITREPGESEADFRRRYHRAWSDQNRRERGISPRGTKGPCSVEGCERPSEAKGMCGKHYRAARVATLTAQGRNPSGKRSHPLYSIWFERKQRGSLCPEWASDLMAFVASVGDRPSKTHLLRRIDNGRPYGPDNWEWFAALKRQPGETKKEWWARKWADRRKREPEYEHRRWLMRKYRMTPEDYAEKMHTQEGVCAICREAETSLHSPTGNVKALAVDHVENPFQVRGLLCFRCNATLGKANHDPALLEAMAAYCREWEAKRDGESDV